LGAEVGEAEDVHVLVSLVCYVRRILGPISPLRGIFIHSDRHGERSEAIFCKYPRRKLGLASMLTQRRLRPTCSTGLV